jgi:hypothetical protein
MRTSKLAKACCHVSLTCVAYQDTSLFHECVVGTTQVQPYNLECLGEEIVLIDTPGFNDTLRSESEILKDIAGWLDYTFRNPPQIKLTGIIYMQAITDRRMYGSTLRNLKMFKELCGESPLKNVVLVTTGWGAAKLSGELDKAAGNEDQLRREQEFWKPLIQRGAQVARFEDTKDSALSVIMSLVGKEPQILQIQKELVMDNSDLINTSAGRVVNEEMKKLEDKYKRELAEIQKEMAEAIAARDVEIQESLAISRAQIEKLRDDARRAQDELQYKSRNDARAAESLRNELQDVQQKLENMKTEQRKQSDAKLEQSLADQRREFQEASMQIKAEQIEQQMKFDGIVNQLRANEQRIRHEERMFLEAKIAELENRGGRKKHGLGSELLKSLVGGLGGVAMSALGFPLFGINPFEGLFDGV